MTIKEIEALLERYYEGETTLQQEHQLREFFRQPGVPPHLAAHRALFGFLRIEANSTVSPGFDDALLDHLRTAPVTRLEPRRKILTLRFSLAASLALIAGLITLFQLGVFTPSQPHGTITDPQLAYAEVRSALCLVSSRFNSGLAQANQLNALSNGLKKMENLQKFRTGLDEMNKINKFELYQPVIINPGRNTNSRP